MSAHNLRPRSLKDYKALHEGENVILRKEQFAPVPEVLPEFYNVERLIARKTFKEGTQYLVKWSGYPIWESTWEPQNHLPTHLYVDFYDPIIDSRRLEYAARAFEMCIKQRLSGRVDQLSLDFDHDIYRYCFQSDKSVILNDSEALSRLPLTRHWAYSLNKFGRGLKIKYPIRLIPRLRERKIHIGENGSLKLLKMPTERLTVIAATMVCDVTTL